MALRTGHQYARRLLPHWRAIYDDKGRVMVAMAFNSDLGDSWEWADDPSYPEKYSALGHSDRCELRRLCDDALKVPEACTHSGMQR